MCGSFGRRGSERGDKFISLRTCGGSRARGALSTPCAGVAGHHAENNRRPWWCSPEPPECWKPEPAPRTVMASLVKQCQESATDGATAPPDSAPLGPSFERGHETMRSDTGSEVTARCTAIVLRSIGRCSDAAAGAAEFPLPLELARRRSGHAASHGVLTSWGARRPRRCSCGSSGDRTWWSTRGVRGSGWRERWRRGEKCGVVMSIS